MPLIKPNLQLVEYPSVILLSHSSKVHFTEENISFCQDLLDYYNYLVKHLGQGVAGLAAPQVGQNLRVFVMFGVLYINPTIVWIPSNGTETAKEGCLSLPIGMTWDVTRPYSVRIKYQTLEGKWQEKKFNNLNARVVYHEMDHLEGRLCCGEDFKAIDKYNASK